MAFANKWVEELGVQARNFNAITAAAAVFIPSLGSITVITIGVIAFATAASRSPVVVCWAVLVKASAFALFSVPVVSVSEALLWGAFPFASI